MFVDVGRTLEASAVRVGLECEAVAEMGGKEALSSVWRSASS